MIVRFRTEGAPDARLPTAVEIAWPLRRGDTLSIAGVRFEVRDVVIAVERRVVGTLGDLDKPWSINDAVAADVTVLEVPDDA